MMSSIPAAQLELRQAYYGGSAYALYFGLAWVLAAIVSWLLDPWSGALTFIILSSVSWYASLHLSRILKCTGKHRKDNPLGHLLVNSNIWYLFSALITLIIAQHSPLYFYPALMLMKGAHYLILRTIYGLKVHSACAFTFILASILLTYFGLPEEVGGILGGIIELTFGSMIYWTYNPRRTI
jgi:hypothetical protein